MSSLLPTSPVTRRATRLQLNMAAASVFIAARARAQGSVDLLEDGRRLQDIRRHGRQRGYAL